MSVIVPTAELAWTQELPKIGGYYWILFPFSPEPSLEKVCIESDGQAFGFDFSGDPGGTAYDELDKYWYYGPITVPATLDQLVVAHPKLSSTGQGMS